MKRYQCDVHKHGVLKMMHYFTMKAQGNEMNSWKQLVQNFSQMFSENS